jgi:hypothetical protein
MSETPQEAGRRWERELAMIVGGKLQPGSGNAYYARGDLANGGAIIWSAKATIHNSFSVSRAVIDDARTMALGPGSASSDVVDATYGAAINALQLPFNQNQFDALTSFVYNVGPGGVATSTGVGRALRAKNWKSAAEHLLDWDKAGGRTLAGLTRRRRAERKLFLTPVAHTDRFYLTEKEREWVSHLERSRRTAARHGGWEKVDHLHTVAAKRAKDALRARVKLLKSMDTKRAHRAARIRAMQDVIDNKVKG